MQFYPHCERKGDCEPGGGTACAGCEIAMNHEFALVMKLWRTEDGHWMEMA